MKGGPSETYAKVWHELKEKNPQAAQFMNANQSYFMEGAKAVDAMKGKKFYRVAQEEIKNMVVESCARPDYVNVPGRMELVKLEPTPIPERKTKLSKAIRIILGNYRLMEENYRKKAAQKA